MKKQKRPPYTLPPTPAAQIYKFILPNGRLIGRPMYQKEANLLLQGMVSQISGIDIIPVEEIELRRDMNLVVLMGGST